MYSTRQSQSTMRDTLANEKAQLDAEFKYLMSGLESIGSFDAPGASRWLAGFREHRRRIWAVEAAEGQTTRSTFDMLYYQAAKLCREFSVVDEDVDASTNASTASATSGSSGA